MANCPSRILAASSLLGPCYAGRLGVERPSEFSHNSCVTSSRLAAAGCRMIRSQRLDWWNDRNNFDPLKHTTTLPSGRVTEDSEPWRHQNIRFKAPGPADLSLIDTRRARSVDIHELRTARLALEGRPEHKCFQTEMSTTMKWDYPKGSSPGWPYGPLYNSGAGRTQRWVGHKPSETATNVSGVLTFRTGYRAHSQSSSPQMCKVLNWNQYN